MFNYRSANNLLEGKIILVTGATQGIGYAAAIEYAKHGATVIILGRNLKKLESLYDEIVQLGYPEPVIHNIDFAKAETTDYQNIANGINVAFGKLDGLLLNAGYLAELRPISQTVEQQWLLSFQVNVHSCFFMCQNLLPLMQQSTSASIIFTTSNVVKGRAYWGAYAASKAAIESLMHTLADEQDGVSNIRVNCINPGAVRTSMRAQAYPLENPLSLPLATDIMPTYLYLMGNDSANINGRIISAQATK